MLQAAHAGANEAKAWFETSYDQLGVELKSNDFEHQEGYHDLITLADTACQNVILEKLKTYKNIPILAEEAEFDKETSDMRQIGLRWVVDPIDGTQPFTQKQNHFSQTIALQKLNTTGQWQTIAGVVGVPLEHCFYFANEHGAWKQEMNGFISPLKVTEPEPDTFSSGARAAIEGKTVENVLYFTEKQDSYRPLTQRIDDALGESVSRKLSTAYQIVTLAQGGLDAAIIGGAGLQYPWDTDAALFIAKQAGAHLLEDSLDGVPVRYIARTATLARAIEKITTDCFNTFTMQTQRGANGRQ